MSRQETRRVLVTGGAGFIGSHLVEALLSRGDQVTAVDNFNDFYSPAIKHKNLSSVKGHSRFELCEGDIRNREDLRTLFAQRSFDVVVHLAAMAGVRPSLENPSLYMDVNVVGTQRLLEESIKQKNKPHFVFGSSSSVYGERTLERFKETDRIDRPISPYSASKIAAEAACYAAHHTRGLNVVCLRFFTVYGERQRPDLAIHKFCRLIDREATVEIYGDGTSQRDYTYVKDIAGGIEAAMELSDCGYEVINLGRSQPVYLRQVVSSLEEALRKKARIVQKPAQPGDVSNTFADIEKARRLLSYAPKTSIKEGIARFVAWYQEEHKEEHSSAGHAGGTALVG